MQESNDPINQHPIQAGYAPADGDIDFFELLDRLWQGKWIILACIVLGLAITSVDAYMSKEVWTSQAKVVAPRPTDMGAHFEKSHIIFNALLQQERYGSVPGRSAFVSDRPLVRFEGKKVADGLFSDFLQIAAMSEGVVVTPPVAGNNLVPYAILSLSADSASKAQNTLANYIKQTDRQTVKQASDDFKAGVQTEIVALKSDQQIALASVDEQKKTQLDQLMSARDVAKRAGLADFVAIPVSGQKGVVVAPDSDYLFLLGQKLLTAQIDSIKDGIVSKPVGYYGTQYKIDALEPLLSSSGPDHAFTYRELPTMPAVRSKPKRFLILVLGVLLGGMAGCGFVLIQSAYRNRRGQRA